MSFTCAKATNTTKRKKLFASRFDVRAVSRASHSPVLKAPWRDISYYDIL
jgi:hypothetical protein